jgi:hypothetical protein
MDRDKLQSLLLKMENQAQIALAEDASFLEALHVLKCEIDSNYQVRAAMRAFRDRGMRVFASLKPRLRIQVHAGETVLALPNDEPGFDRSIGRTFEDFTDTPNEPLVREMLDAASSVLVASRHCRYLEQIISEAVQANRAFERMAKAIEGEGYELRICLDLSTYAHVYPKDTGSEAASTCYARQVQTVKPLSSDSAEGILLSLSGQDAQFLKDLRISLE